MGPPTDRPIARPKIPNPSRRHSSAPLQRASAAAVPDRQAGRRAGKRPQLHSRPSKRRSRARGRVRLLPFSARRVAGALAAGVRGATPRRRRRACSARARQRQCVPVRPHHVDCSGEFTGREPAATPTVAQSDSSHGGSECCSLSQSGTHLAMLLTLVAPQASLACSTDRRRAFVSTLNVRGVPIDLMYGSYVHHDSVSSSSTTSISRTCLHH